MDMINIHQHFARVKAGARTDDDEDLDYEDEDEDENDSLSYHRSDMCGVGRMDSGGGRAGRRGWRQLP
jgi:hypothetical protein